MIILTKNENMPSEKVRSGATTHLKYGYAFKITSTKVIYVILYVRQNT